MSYTSEQIRTAVRDRYTREATEQSSCCGSEQTGTASRTRSRTASGGNSCCGQGYSAEELQSVSPEANLGLGCGNPMLFADLKEGETVVDLGSGGGLDCLLAAQRVGESGAVIGVDMTPEMLERARAAAERSGATNVTYRLGEIEALPLADAGADAIISNCVVNLSPEKQRVFAEAFRVLRPGGRLAISDIVAEHSPTAAERADMDLYSACISGAEQAHVLEQMLRTAGFHQISIEGSGTQAEWDAESEGGRPVMPVYSAMIKAVKPGEGR
jgi:SAM-dependent methyltransferase